MSNGAPTPRDPDPRTPGRRRASFTCPRCGWASANPQDLAKGYCGHCHDYTGQEPMRVEALWFALSKLLAVGHYVYAYEGEEAAIVVVDDEGQEIQRFLTRQP